MNKTFHFQNYEMAIRYHISKRLIQKGWQITPTPQMASFTDANLSLNDAQSIVLEYKHLLGYLGTHFFAHHIPETYAIDDKSHEKVLKKLRKHKDANHPWILKPSLLNNGDYILVFENMAQIQDYYQSPKRLGGFHVVQKYIENPHLWEGRKYTFRMPVIMTNDAGVFMHEQGYFNVSAVPYSKTIEPLNRRKHLTNYILNNQLSGITQLSTYDYPGFEKVRSQFAEIVRDVVKAVLALFPNYLTKTSIPIFEIFGFDFILDDNLKPWLLEINQGPDFPLTPQHPLYGILWEPFWQRVVEGFVEPTLEGKGRDARGFLQVLDEKDTHQVPWLAQLKGKWFLHQVGHMIRIQ